MDKKFVGREAIVAAIPELKAAKVANYKSRIEFTLEGLGTYESGYQILNGDSLAFFINEKTVRIHDVFGTRILIGDQYNNLTPHNLTSITLKS